MPDFLTHQERAYADQLDALTTRAEPGYYDRDGKPITHGEAQALRMRDHDDPHGAWYGRVAYDVVGNCEVSTVWLGLNHNFGSSGRPLIFETMVFNPGGDGMDTRRYPDLASAQAGHAECVQFLRTLPADLDGETHR